MNKLVRTLDPGSTAPIDLYGHYRTDDFIVESNRDGKPLLIVIRKPTHAIVDLNTLVDRAEFKRKARRLTTKAKARGWTIRINHDFAAAAEAIARHHRQPSGKDAWLGPNLRRHLNELHQLGVAHSAEMWVEGQLVAANIGIDIGNATQQMGARYIVLTAFCERNAASGAGLHLAYQTAIALQQAGVPHIDFVEKRVKEPASPAMVFKAEEYNDVRLRTLFHAPIKAGINIGQALKTLEQR